MRVTTRSSRTSRDPPPAAPRRLRRDADRRVGARGAHRVGDRGRRGVGGGVSKPRLLDLFCGAGGAAMGYSRAGFEVVGIDIKPQPRYPFEFHQADAMTFPLDGFDAIHASPPCQPFSRASQPERRLPHLDLIDDTRARLVASGTEWVMENLPEAPMHGLVLCAVSFGLEVIRHRRFESSVLLMGPPCSHVRGGLDRGLYLSFRRGRSPHTGIRRRGTPVEYREAMGVPWMRGLESQEAIPPAFTEHIGRQLLAHLAAVAA